MYKNVYGTCGVNTRIANKQHLPTTTNGFLPTLLTHLFSSYSSSYILVVRTVKFTPHVDVYATESERTRRNVIVERPHGTFARDQRQRHKTKCCWCLNTWIHIKTIIKYTNIKKLEQRTSTPVVVVEWGELTFFIGIVQIFDDQAERRIRKWWWWRWWMNGLCICTSLTSVISFV